MSSPHPWLPQLTPGDLLLRRTHDGWRVEDARGQAVCDRLDSLAEARLVGRTFVAPRGRVWMCDGRHCAVLDDD